ncbi:hypothetical protein SAMN05421810_101811 [Amycolatopsis arida]|uniref:Excreted virulence factor EspC, type VII ESX diderm n=1 Tax=Amycolatopsis arida TaxID=587909 RepID=A0A1I5M685_9PSEU|nr:hypothetical protein [Amycolatopsis arida]TDX93986.1 hypothetical protein CLV69_104443 [Amycolatopsis arida]SFP05082.1 hypothetical protein SAMN05421810_101811 [Amycolatopsis arida]
MDGTPHRGFWVEDGAYETYARNVDPLGEEIRGAGGRHVAPHTELAGDGFSAMGGESGFTGAYAARMRELQRRMGTLGGKWEQMGDAARRTAGNYAGVEADHQAVMNRLRGELG